MTKDLPKTAKDLQQIASEEGVDLVDLSQVFSLLPTGDNEDITYLEAASQCILETSNLVDNTYHDMDQIQKAVIKLRLMSRLLSLKAQQLLG